jgi:hypothetical protein
MIKPLFCIIALRQFKSLTVKPPSNWRYSRTNNTEASTVLITSTAIEYKIVKGNLLGYVPNHSWQLHSGRILARMRS